MRVYPHRSSQRVGTLGQGQESSAAECIAEEQGFIDSDIRVRRRKENVHAGLEEQEHNHRYLLFVESEDDFNEVASLSRRT